MKTMKTSIKTVLAALMLLAISCSKESLHNPQAASTQTQDNATAQTTGHYIGQRFGGGIIFAMNKDSLHGLIADTVDLPQATWWNGTYILAGATESGKINTRKIVAAQGRPGNYPALECAKSKRSGYTDWFLPSKDQLNKLYMKKDVVGGFADFIYWSSSEYDINSAWDQAFYNGFYNASNKSNAFYVRAVRGF